MRACLAAVCAAGAALLIAPAAAAQEALNTVKLADGVYAILQPENARFNDANSVLIVGPTAAMVIDTQVDPDSSRRVIAEIKKVTDKPVRHVIATHWHGDHFQGNDAYREAYPGVEFVAHALAAGEMRTRAPRQRDEDVARMKKSRPAEADRLAKLNFVFPTMQLGEQTTWRVGTREVRLLHYRGHTSGDIAVYLPSDRILITGDLVDDMPYLGHGFPADYLKTLDALVALEWDTMVPGHGSVRRNKDHLSAVAAAFKAVYSDVSRAVAEGLTLEQTKARVDLGPHRAKLTYGDARAGRAFDGFMAAAIERMYEERKGDKPF
jgi:cyclase